MVKISKLFQKHFLFLLILLPSLHFLFTACSQRNRESAPIVSMEMQLQSGPDGSTISSFAAPPTLKGGLMIYGVRQPNQEILAVKVRAGDPDPSLVLTNGSWKFWAVGWEGGTGETQLEGTVRCAMADISLTGVTASVFLSLKTSNCQDISFGGSEFFSAANVQFKKLKIFTCRNFSGVSDGNSDCSGTNFGPAKSFKVQLHSFQKVSGNLPTPNESIVSRCVNTDTNSPYATTEIMVPMGSGDQVYFPTTVVAYSNANCSGTTKEYFREKGFNSSNTNTLSSSKVFSSSGHTNFYLISDNFTANSAIVVSPQTYAFGTFNVGQSSANSTFTVSNTGNAPAYSCTVSVQGANSNDFSVVSETCSATAGIPPGGTCSIVLKGTPSSADTRTGTLTVTCTQGGVVSSNPNGITVVGQASRVLDIETGGDHTCVLLGDSTIRCWGLNSSGQLGHGNTTTIGDNTGEMGTSLSTIDLGTSEKVVQISAGNTHSCALLANRSVKCWGFNSTGQLGSENTNTLGDQTNEMGSSLTALTLGSSGGKKTLQITTGDAHTCALTEDSALKCWGDGAFGQLGYDNVNVIGDGSGEMGSALADVNFGTYKYVRQVSAGGSHTCAIMDDSKVKCWGKNTSGQLGYENTNHQGDNSSEMAALNAINLGTNIYALQIATGKTHSCALLNDSTVKCWGDNTYGQLGKEHTNNLGDGSGEMSSLTSIDFGGSSTVRQIAAGAYHNCVILDNSSVKCWGKNTEGQIGIGGTAHIGDGANEMGNNLQTVDLGTGRHALSLTAGDSHTCALLDNSTFKCWGKNTNGQLGKGHTNHLGDGTNEMGSNMEYIDVGTTSRFARLVSAGQAHTCAILDDSKIRCWGGGGSGQLGNGVSGNTGYATAEMGASLPSVDLGTNRWALGVSAGAGHTCALLDNSSIKCWGHNAYGQLGLGTTDSMGDQPNEMGNSLTAVDLGSGLTARQVSAGRSHSCAVLSNSSVKCWGHNDQGQLGQDSTNNLGDQTNEMGSSLAAINLGSAKKALKVEAGYYSTCALLDSSQNKCWGKNQYGQLGQLNTTNVGNTTSTMASLNAISIGANLVVRDVISEGEFACATLQNSSHKCWGRGDLGQLGQESTANHGNTSTQMADYLSSISFASGNVKVIKGFSSESHSCVMLTNGTAKCWGGNSAGQLGKGSTTNIGSSSAQMGGSLSTLDVGTNYTVRNMDLGNKHSCAILDNGRLKCWGENQDGQLGLALPYTTKIGDAAGEMGDSLNFVELW